MADERTASAGDTSTLPLPGVPGHTAMRDAIARVEAAPSRSWIARIFGKSPLGPEATDAFHVAIGEIEVAAELDLLGSEWHVLHSVPVGPREAVIDHLVIGPAGVFLVDTTVHTGASVWASGRSFVVSGVRHPAIRNMEYEMGRVERLLSAAAGCAVEVSGVLAVVGPKSLIVRDDHRDVVVLRASMLSRWLQGEARRLEPRQVEAITGVASLVRTWDAAPADCQDTTRVRTRFDTLRAEVQRAWAVQRGWATALVLVAAGTFVAITYLILVSAFSR
jgi:hypothetical protein